MTEELGTTFFQLDPKNEDFEKIKKKIYTKLSSYPEGVFRFIYSNNHIVNQISHSDITELENLNHSHHDKIRKVFVGSLFGMVLLDQGVFRYGLPNFSVGGSKYKIPKFLLKYVLFPAVATALYQNRSNNSFVQAIREKNKIYHFDQRNIDKILDSYCRAHRAGKLEELLNSSKDRNFDWSGIPE